MFPSHDPDRQFLFTRGEMNMSRESRAVMRHALLMEDIKAIRILGLTDDELCEACASYNGMDWVMEVIEKNG